ncbi:MAG: hypothetical protein JNM33_04220 [Rubrivivax sp.]|nr:hypothetical protein [Rubrivivax sp.]
MNTALRTTVLCLALGFSALDSRAEDFDLITAAEAQAEAKAAASAPPETRTRSLPVPKPGQPAIKVVTPNNTPSNAVNAPVRIEVSFKAASGNRIVPSTFRVLYGLMKIDLTDRLKKHATVTESGVVINQAKVPAGQHRLILQVADDQGNTAEQELRLRVGAAS